MRGSGSGLGPEVGLEDLVVAVGVEQHKGLEGVVKHLRAYRACIVRVYSKHKGLEGLEGVICIRAYHACDTRI